jgi:hypothetical protein
MRYCVFIAFLVLMACQKAPSAPEKVAKPKGFKATVSSVQENPVLPFSADGYFKGEVQSSVSWQDKNGYNIALLSQTGAYQSLSAKEAIETGGAKEVVNGFDAELYAYHYVKQNNTWQKKYGETWVEWQCPYGLNLQFQNPILLSDVNKNGFAELLIQLKDKCGKIDRKVQVITENAHIFSLATGEGMKTVTGDFRKNKPIQHYSLSQWERF